MSDESRHDSDENVYNINEICNNLLMGGSMIVPIITYLCILLISILSVVSIGSILTVVGIEFGKNDLLIKDTNKYKLLKYLKNDYDTIIKLNIFLILKPSLIYLYLKIMKQHLILHIGHLMKTFILF